MLGDHPLRGAHPSGTRWVAYLWIAMLASNWLRAAWRGHERRKAANWPVAEARIESTGVTQVTATLFSRSRRSGSYQAELGYSYATTEGRDAGWYRRGFWNDEEAYAFIRDLKGKSLAVHYDPTQPSRSSLSESALDLILRNRAPVPAAESYTAEEPVPEWFRPFLPALIWISAAGFAASLWVHGGAIMGRLVAPESVFVMLQAGGFLVWIPSVWIARRVAGNMGRGGDWGAVLKQSPEWVRYAVNGFFGYILVNFLWTSLLASQVANSPAARWRLLSGHLMAFYSAALAVLYSAANTERVRT